MQVPTTVNNNACIIVNQSIVLPKSKKKTNDDLNEQCKKANSNYITFNSKTGSKDVLRKKSGRGSSKKKSPKSKPLKIIYLQLQAINIKIYYSFKKNYLKSRILIFRRKIALQSDHKLRQGIKIQFVIYLITIYYQLKI
jgi:hypothetical protein